MKEAHSSEITVNIKYLRNWCCLQTQRRNDTEEHRFSDNQVSRLIPNGPKGETWPSLGGLYCCPLLPQETWLPVSSLQIKSTVCRKDPSPFSSAAAVNAETDQALVCLLDTRKPLWWNCQEALCSCSTYRTACQKRPLRDCLIKIMSE